MKPRLGIFIMLLFALLAASALFACTKDRPPDDGTPAPIALKGEFISEYGSFYFNGDGQSVVINVKKEHAEAMGIPEGRSEGSYVFIFHNEQWRRDMAETFRITIDGKTYSFRNMIGNKDENSFGFYIDGRSEAVVFKKK